MSADGIMFKTTVNGDTPVSASNPLPVTTSSASAISGIPSFTTLVTGELAGSASAVVMPTLAVKLVKFKAAYDNAGRAYIGISTVTKKDGTTDTTTGFELSASEETPWLPISNLNLLYRICDNAGDDLTYIALVS